MKRHEIWSAAGGPGYAGKPRPVIILQSEHIVQGPSVTTAGFTSSIDAVPGIRPLVIGSEQTGLLLDSRIMVDKIMTFPRHCLGHRLGALTPQDSIVLDRAVLLFLGFSL